MITIMLATTILGTTMVMAGTIMDMAGTIMGMVAMTTAKTTTTTSRNTMEKKKWVGGDAVGKRTKFKMNPTNIVKTLITLMIREKTSVMNRHTKQNTFMRMVKNVPEIMHQKLKHPKQSTFMRMVKNVPETMHQNRKNINMKNISTITTTIISMITATTISMSTITTLKKYQIMKQTNN
jgi:hypothetical protein